MYISPLIRYGRPERRAACNPAPPTTASPFPKTPHPHYLAALPNLPSPSWHGEITSRVRYRLLVAQRTRRPHRSLFGRDAADALRPSSLPPAPGREAESDDELQYPATNGAFTPRRNHREGGGRPSSARGLPTDRFAVLFEPVVCFFRQPTLPAYRSVCPSATRTTHSQYRAATADCTVQMMCVYWARPIDMTNGGWSRAPLPWQEPPLRYSLPRVPAHA